MTGYARIVHTRLNIVPAILSAIGFIVLVYGIIAFLNAQSPAPLTRSAAKKSAASATPPDTAALHQQVTDLSKRLDGLAGEALKEHLDAIYRQASQVQSLLSVFLGVAGLFTLAQGIFAFFSAQNYVKQAEDAIKRANDTEASIHEKFPIFTDMEYALVEGFSELSRRTPVLDHDYENLYARYGSVERQTIFAIESFSGIRFLRATNRSEELIRQMRFLGKFYAGKFLKDSSDGRQPLKSDFERSYYYFDLALQKSNRNYSALSDMGWLYALVADPKDPDKGRAFFEESLRANSDQQRALFNLSTLAFDKSNRAQLEQAKTYLLKARKIQKWEEAPNPVMASHIDYNLACIFDALAGTETDPAVRSKLLDQCLRLSGRGSAAWRATERIAGRGS